jgi:hypothetical protein
MALRPQIRAYLCSAIYAALIIGHLCGPRLVITALFQLALYVSLLALVILLISYRREIGDAILEACRACAALLLCLIATPASDWLPPAYFPIPSDSFRSALFQRPPPRFA